MDIESQQGLGLWAGSSHGEVGRGHTFQSWGLHTGPDLEGGR